MRLIKKLDRLKSATNNHYISEIKPQKVNTYDDVLFNDIRRERSSAIEENWIIGLY